MIDLKLLQNNIEAMQNNLAARKVILDLDNILKIIKQERELNTEISLINAEIKKNAAKANRTKEQVYFDNGKKLKIKVNALQEQLDLLKQILN